MDASPNRESINLIIRPKTVYYTLTFALLLAEMGTFVALLLPMPFSARKKLFTFLSTSLIVAKIAYVLKIAFVYVSS